MERICSIPRERKFDIIVGFSICQEEVIRYDTIPRDENDKPLMSKIPVSSNHYIGGTAFDIAILLQTLGLKVKLLATVGQDEEGPGRQFIERRLKKYTKIPYHLLPVRRGTSAARIVIEKGFDPIILSKKTGYLNIPIEEVREQAKKANPALMIASGVMPEEIPMVEAMFNVRPEAPCFLNPRPELLKERSLFGKLLKLNPFIFLNHQELGVYLDTDIREDGVTKEIVSQFHEAGADNVIVTCNEQGAIFSSEPLKLWIQQPIIRFDEPVDKTGAGDSFLAAVIAAVLKKKSPEEMMLWGATMAGLKVLREGGANVPSLAEFEGALKR